MDLILEMDKFGSWTSLRLDERKAGFIKYLVGE